MSFKQLTGSGPKNDRVYWNDSEFTQYQQCSPAPAIVDASVDGVAVADAANRGWLSTDKKCNDADSPYTGTWGNDRSLDTWSYGLSSAEAELRYGGVGAFTLQKRATNGVSFTEGEDVNWAFTVTNTGTTPLTNVSLDDELFGLDDWLCAATLGIGETADCTAPVAYKTTATDATNGTVGNVVVATAEVGPGATAPGAQTAYADVLVTAKEPTPEPPVEPPVDPGESVDPTTPVRPADAGDLAATGTPVMTPILVAGAALMLGGAAVLLARRNKAKH